ncbi:MAG TPA: hypothetical protein VFY48_08685 [Solirubrobacterales bacterium]|nr:hypothetical protein [Solirubrobacterales bacterium]
MRTWPGLLAALACASLALGGCGDDGAAENAVVSVYVSAYLCDSAKRELAKEGARVGKLRVRVRCLPSAERGGRLDLAALGAGARKVTEDSTAVAYAENAGAANRFVPPIVESAGIAITYTSAGELAISRVLHAMRRAEGSGDPPREAVAEEMDGLFDDNG